MPATPAPTIPEPSHQTLEIGFLGEDADGTVRAVDGNRLVHVPGALPGERVVVSGTGGRSEARLEVLLTRSQDRVEPICALVPDCGGCALQHQAQAANLAWKSARVARALELAGFNDPMMSVPIQVDLGSRRRMDLGVIRVPEGRIELGLHRRRHRDIVDMTECHILDPALFALLAPTRDALRSLRCLTRVGSLVMNRLDSGSDLLLRTDRAPDTNDRTRLAAFAAAHDVCRVAWQHENVGHRSAPETVAQLAPARVLMRGRAVEIPSGAFLQATAQGEAAIIDAVMAGLPSTLPPKSRIVEFYAGCGTLTLALATAGRVVAYEGDPGAAAALISASGGMRIEVRRRDLALNPVAASEIRDAGVIVLDPPYAGAGRQMDEVVRTSVGTVILVSCNPAALSREAGTLQKVGFQHERSTTIDQFLFSPRIESVSVFRRGSSRRSHTVLSRSDS